jgi:hypothetical protein
MTRNVWFSIGGLLIAAVLFQVFLHYEYIHLAGGSVMRIDRLTGTSCYMPCTPKPTPSPFDLNAAADYLRESDRQDQQAILLAKATSTAAKLVATVGPGYAWTARTTDGDGLRTLQIIAEGRVLPGHADPLADFGPTPPSQDEVRAWRETRRIDVHSPSFETKLVCYCNTKRAGWRWEVHTDTREVFYVNDNSDLMKKYGIR